MEFKTITEGSTGWKEGQEIHIVVISGKKYIRTDQNAEEADNLENLPELMTTNVQIGGVR